MKLWKCSIGLSKKELFISFCGAMLVLLWNMKNSFEFGRLAFIPSYDDVSYFEDAVRRYLVLLNGNFLSIIRDAVVNPPHAPLLATQAVLSYMIFGVQDWGPYLLNIWMPFLAFVGVMRVTRELPTLRIPLFVYLLTLPMLGASIVEYRPDISAGILTALCVTVAVYAVTANQARIITNETLWSGFLMGGALWVKPSAFIYNTGLIGLGLLLAVVALFLSRRQLVVLGLKRAFTISIIGFALATPYYAVAGRRVIEYTWNAVVRDKSIWEVNLEWAGHAAFYIFGHGGRFMLGLDVWTMIIAVLVFALRYRSIEPLQRLRFFVLLGVSLGGYVVVALSTVKTHFLGVGFQATWVVISVLIFVEFFRSQKEKLLTKLLPPLLLVISVLAIQPAGFWGLRQSAQAQGVRTLVEDVTSQLVHYAGVHNQPQSVFMTFTGFLNRDVLSYNLLKQGVTSIQISTWFFRPKEEDPLVVFGSAINRADVVIAATEGTWGADLSMPSNRILPLTLGMIQNNSEFILLKDIPSAKGNVYIYIRKIKPGEINGK